MDVPEPRLHTRRQALVRLAAAGGAVAWTAPVVQVLTLDAASAETPSGVPAARTTVTTVTNPSLVPVAREDSLPLVPVAVATAQVLAVGTAVVATQVPQSRPSPA